MDITPFKLPDAAFWADDERGSDAMARELVGEHRGVLVDAPARVELASRSTLPMGIYHLGAIRDLAATRFDRLGAVTVMDLTANQLYAVSGRELVQDTDIIEAPPRDVRQLPDGDMSTTYATELRSLVSLPWQPGKYRITALLRDQVSNRVDVELVGGTRGAPEPLTISPPPEPNVVTYQAHPNSPEMPQQPGIALRPTRVVDLRKAWKWPVYGSFRLGPRIPHAATTETVIRVHLLLSGADDGSLDVIPIAAPARRQSGEFATGYFGLDLMALTLLREPQTYFVTAFSGEYMTETLPTALLGT